jgi:hypothetical protein
MYHPESGDKGSDSNYSGCSDDIDNWTPVDSPSSSPSPSLVDVEVEAMEYDDEYDGFVHVDHEDLEIYD